MTSERLGEPGALLERWRAASIEQSADDFRELYAPDAVYEFPFTAPGFPSRLSGREAILEFVVATWETGLVNYERYETINVYVAANDPRTVIVEQVVHGTSPTKGSFTLPNLVIMTVVNGQIEFLRDYANLLAAARALGMQL